MSFTEQTATETVTTSRKSASMITGAEALGQMLRTRRPHGSKTERRFIKTWLKPLGLDEDAYGNLSCRIGSSNVLWSCHTDTVHRTGGQQALVMHNGVIGLAASEKESNCLGADDTAGVWLMREMIMAGKPGLYVFHRNEECGGRGSHWIAANNSKMLSDIDIAIALDRKGTTSVITHQFTRCCSDQFGLVLADQLGGGFKLDDGGIFTDTANYTDLVAECTNLSVGYEAMHSKKECVDVAFLLGLKERLLALDLSKLPVTRDPIKDHDEPLAFDWFRDERDWRSNTKVGTEVDFEPSYGMSLADLVREFPDETADFLEAYGLDADELARYIADVHGLSRR